MPVARWKLAALPLATLGLASPLLSSCHGSEASGPTSPIAVLGAGAASACEEMKTGDFTSLQFMLTGDAGQPLPTAGENVKRLLTQAQRLSRTAPGLEKEIIEACAELGRAAGVFEGDLQAEPDSGHGAEKVCNAAAAKVGLAFRLAKEAKVFLDLSVEPMRCFVDVDAARKCLADCGAPPLKGDMRAHCIGGEIDGACQGRCSGSCFVPAGSGSGTCHAACSGKCDHDFRGACGGKCSGTCDGAPTRGPKACGGVCDGSCSDKGEGACAGRCDGACSGGWEPRDVGGKCPGLCVGVCSGEVREPVCSGEYTPPGVDTVCQAGCAAASAMSTRCEPPLVRVAVRGGKPTPALEKLLAGVQSAVPKIVRLQQGAGKRLPRAMEGAITAAVDWSNAYATAGVKPLGCVRAGIDAMRESAKWTDLTVRGIEAIAPAIKTDPPPPPKADDE